MKILLADDDHDECELFGDCLRDLGDTHQFTCVTTGDELFHCLRLTNTELPDLLFLDMNMPKKNGLICLKEMKADVGLKGIPVILLSTAASPENIEVAFTLGAFFFLLKPSTFKAMTKVLRHLLAFDWKSQSPTPRDKFLLTDRTFSDL